VENALLDLLARQQKQPLCEFIGGSRRRIMSGISIGIQENPADLLAAIGRAVEKKYHRIKIKIKRGGDTGILEQVRRSFPDIKLMVDANADYTIDDLELLKKLDSFDLMMIEQPLEYNDLYFHSRLQKALKTPICLDESIKNLNDARAAIKMESGRIINIKQGRVGGLLAARDIQDHCLKNGVACWSGGMLETGIGRAFNLHLQTLPGFTLPGDTSETARYFHEDIVDKPVELDDEGFIDIPDGPGTGVEVVPGLLKKYTLHSERL
jgi:O-succinylbenzoate synthase